MKLRLLAASLAMLALTACDNTTARYSSDYASKLSRNEILILPANVEANMIDASGGKTREYNYEDHIAPILATELQKQLEAKGYKSRIFHKADLMNDKTYREYDAFREGFNTAYEETYKKGQVAKREEAMNTTMPLGGRAKALGAKINAPVFAYVDYDETVSTTDAQVASLMAQVAMSLLTGSSTATPPDTTHAVIALVDSENDKVLWTNAGASAGGGMGAAMFYTDEEQALQHIQNSLTWSLRELPNKDDLFKKEDE